MQRNHVILGGLESAYMQKLALYLTGRFGSDVQVGVIDKSSPDGFRYPNAVWIGSQSFLQRVQKEQEQAYCIWLSEEDEDDGICRYQSCEKLYQKIMAKDWTVEGALATSVGARKDLWMTLTTDQSTAFLTVFSFLCAQNVCQKGATLFVNLSECSGMEQLFGTEEGMDLTDLILALRAQEHICLDAYLRRLEMVDCIFPPKNPMILHELREADIRKLIQEIRRNTNYEYVIVALGNTCCGCQQLFRQSTRMLHLTGEGLLAQSSCKEWSAFVQLCAVGHEEQFEEIQVEEFLKEDCFSLSLPEWMDSKLGQFVATVLAKPECA